MIAQSTKPDSTGELSLPILSDGQYEVQVGGSWGLTLYLHHLVSTQVKGAGIVATRKSYTVSCDPSDCSRCNPTVVVPVSPSLAEDKLRLTLGGDNQLGNLVSSSTPHGPTPLARISTPSSGTLPLSASSLGRARVITPAPGSMEQQGLLANRLNTLYTSCFL